MIFDKIATDPLNQKNILNHYTMRTDKYRMHTDLIYIIKIP